jgi:hypothetical protein
MKFSASLSSLGKTLRRLQGVVWVLALVGYFGPWIGHDAAALAWNAYDLFDIARFLPPVESGALTVNIQALRLPLIGLAVLIPMFFCRAPFWQRGLVALLGSVLALSTLPPYPQILTAWRTPGWRVPFWWSIGALGGIGAVALAGSRLARLAPWLTVAWAAMMGIPAYVTFSRLRPLIRALHAASIQVGWGYWMCGLGLALLATSAWLEGLVLSQEGA